MENFDEFGVYSDTSDWSAASTPAGNATSPGIDWNAILQTGIPRLFDLAQTSIILENGRPVLAGQQNPLRTNWPVTTNGGLNSTGLLLLALAGVAVYLIAKG